MPISSTYCEHWSVSITGSRYSRMNLEKADRKRLIPFASFWYANVPLAKLNAITSIEFCSAISSQRYTWEQSSLQNKFFPAICCSASVKVLWMLLFGWLFLYSLLLFVCIIFGGQTIGAVSHFVLFVRIL